LGSALPASLEDDKSETIDTGLELEVVEYPPDDILLIDRARSRSVMRARSALCDLTKKCCSLALRGLDCVGWFVKTSSSLLADVLALARRKGSFKENRRSKEVGVISGVGRPA